MGEPQINNVHAGHRQRLKDRFLSEGLDNFPPHNILEIALFYVDRRHDTNEIAHRLIDNFGSFAGVCDAPYETLCEVEGVGKETAKFLKLIPELARTYEVSKTEKIAVLDGPEKAIEFFAPRFIGKTNECLMITYLDGRGELLNCKTLAEGDDTSVLINSRAIMLEAVALHARGIILAHNHPHGFCSPSAQDIAMTDNLAVLMEEVGVKVCDHLIFSRDDVCRMSRYASSLRDYYIF